MSHLRSNSLYKYQKMIGCAYCKYSNMDLLGVANSCTVDGLKSIDCYGRCRNLEFDVDFMTKETFDDNRNY